MVKASNRMKATDFKTSSRFKRGKNHLKFPFFRDEEIGFGQHRLPLIEGSADEDYETDRDILRRTIQVCKKDCLFALNKQRIAPTTFHLGLSNNKY